MKQAFVILFSIVATLLLSSCNSSEQKETTKLQKLNDMGRSLDSAIAAANHTKSNLDKIEKTVKELLIQYYKAGWMDASNAMIELHNQNIFTDYNVQKKRNSNWRRIETEVESKSAIPK